MSKKDDTVVNTLLNKTVSYDLIAKPHSSVSIPLRIYQDINVVFGQKGTGKSEIINSLYDSMVSKDLQCTKYIGSEKDDDFKALTNNGDMIADVEKLGISNCKDEFEYIMQWIDKTPTLLLNYVNWYKTKDNNVNKARMKITNSTTELVEEPKHLDTHRTDYTNIKGAQDFLRKIDISQYFETEVVQSFNDLLDALSSSIKHEFASDLIDINSQELAIYTINRLKSIADKNSNSVSKPSTTGFKEYAMNRIELKKTLSNILMCISDKEFSEFEVLGEIEEKGLIRIRRLYRMLCDASRTIEFKGKIRALKEIKSQFLEIQNNIVENDLNGNVDKLKQLCEENSVKSADAFLGCSKQIVTSDGNEYSPSNGERGILMLQRALEKDVDAYFIDEPELGMGNSYVNNTICPQIEKLKKMHKVIVIATHNANIAVRSLPYNSVFRTHENGIYKTYAGNPFNDKLINVEDESDVKSWTYESMHTLEGGKEAFYERKYIYESND